MQDLAHLIINSKKVLVLRRLNSFGHYVSLKKRASGKDGTYLPDESYYLEDNPNLLNKLLSGEVVKL